MARPIKPSDLLAPPPPMDPPSDRREIVIKVNHGNTLRRIGAYVHGQLMDHNMNKLRAKIISLFKFSPDADFILTYTDEDGDVVTLDDDDELRDAVIAQRLNPLRINIKLKSSTIAGIDARSEASSLTASNSPESATKPLNIQSAVDEALKSVPEPFRTAISDLLGDVLKIATSAPAFAQFVEYFSKLAFSNASHHFDCITGDTGDLSGQTGNVPADPLDLNVGDESKDSGVPAKETNTTVPFSPAQKQHVCGNIVQGFGTTATASVNLNQQTDRNKNVSPNALDDSVMHDASNSKQLPGYGPAPPTSEIGVSDHSDGPTNRHIGALPTDFPFQMGPIPKHVSSLMMPTDVPFPMGPILKHCSSPMIIHPNKRPYSFQDLHNSAPGNFHQGVQCDGCGMLPIVGSRFQSKVKDDYDLCKFCISKMGNEADYTRIDRPVYCPPAFLSKMIHSLNYNCSSSALVKLESLFIQDVTVLDGTVMAPSTRFTKIWRMRNNGTVAWPLGTQLVWVGGDQFGDQGCTDLEHIPANGFPVEGELDIAVDFTAPSVPGQYVSYWRMASPSGQRFGQRVWVLIKVDHSRPNTHVSSSAHPLLNLNLRPGGNCPTGFGIIDVNVAPLDVDFPEANTNCRAHVGHPVHPVDSVLDAANDGLSQPTQPAVVPPTSSDPLADLPSVPSPLVASPLKKLEGMGFNQAPLNTEIPLNKEILRKNNYDLEQCMNDPDIIPDNWDLLLAEMEEMGFSDKELNRKMLKKNGGSIKRAVLDLVAGEKL